MTYTQTLTTNSNNHLTTLYNNTKFNIETLNYYLPNIEKLIHFFYSHNITTLNIDDCFQTSMTLLSRTYNLDYIKNFTVYLFFTLKQSKDFITK